MNILLFGISNVGKTSAGMLLAQKLGYDFYDLDDEVKKYYKVTLEEFVNTGTLRERDQKRGIVIDRILRKKRNKVFAISPIAYSENFNYHLLRKDVFAIDMLDTPKNIFDRLVFSDENDEIYEDTEYKNAHKDYYLSDIREDIFFYEQSYSHIKNKFFVNNDRIEKVADRLIKEFKLENL